MYDTEIWLVAVAVDVPEDEVRRYWNVKETPLLDQVLATGPAFRLGATEAKYQGNEERRGPVGRVHDVMFLRGTTPDYQLPRVDDDLERDLLNAFTRLPDDPAFDTGNPAELASFLAVHRGERLATRERPL